MSDLDITKVKFYDDRVVQSKPSYAIQESNLATTNTAFRAISYTQSTLNFNINTPSLSTFIDRKVPITAEVNMEFQVVMAQRAGALAGDLVCSIAKDVALAPYPLHSCFNSVQVSINDSVVSSQVSDHIYEVARLTDLPFNREQRTTPSLLDNYSSYNDAAGANNNPLASYFDAIVETHEPRGAFSAFQFCNGNGVAGAGAVSANIELDGDGNPVLTNAGATAVQAGNVTETLYVQFRVTEYLQVSPFIFNEQESEDTALFGVQNLQILCNIGSPARALRFIRTGNTNSCVPVNGSVRFNHNLPSPFIEQPVVNMTFITAPLSLSLPERSVTPYMEYNVYKTTNATALPAHNGSYKYSNSQSIVSNTIVLSQVPDYLLIWAKPQSYTMDSGDFYCPISELNILFDNYSGLLSSFNQEKLYEMTYANNMKMTWNQFRGMGKVASSAGGDNCMVSLTSCPIVLQMGKDLTMSSGLASGVLAQLSLQVKATCHNTLTGSAVTPDLYIMPVNSGFCVTQQGQTMVIKAPLSESDVLSAPTGRVMGRKALGRFVGGNFMESISSAVGKLKNLWDKVPSGVKDVVKDVAKEGIAVGTDFLADTYAPGAKEGMRKVRKALIGRGQNNRGSGQRTGAGKNKKVSLKDLY